MVGERLVFNAVQHAQDRQRVEVVGIGGEIRRPIDAYVLALVPRSIDRVLGDDVELLARGRVVFAANVEVTLDGECRHDDAILSLRASRYALGIGAIYPFV